MGKPTKVTGRFFIGENDCIAFCDTCKKCAGDCKQSFRVVIVICPKCRPVDKEMKKCMICGGAFAPKGRKAYCSEACEKEGTRIKNRSRKRKQRETRN